MIKTKTYGEIFNKIKDKKKCILHCWGVPGSGKSQIVRKLADEFPFSNDNKSTANTVVKWHIQCKDSEQKVKKELQNLAEELLTNAYIQKKEVYESITTELQDNKCDKLYDKLRSCSFPVLIIIEDPGSDEKNLNKSLLQDFLRKLSSSDSQLLNNDIKIHLYITSRKNNPILHEDETKDQNIYVKEKVKGFNKQEALQYMLNQCRPILNNKALQIFKRFSGLPLGLLGAKRYCDEAKINYTGYLELLKESEFDIMEEEQEKIKKEFGNSAEHVFQAIVLPFLPSDESADNKPCLHYKILKCLSYFNYGRIPVFAVEYFFDLIINESKVKATKKKIKADVGNLVSKLLEHDMCSKTDEGEITFREVVSHAFRLNSHTVGLKSFNALEKAIEGMSGLIIKNMRKTERSHQIFNLRRHAQTLLEHFENHQEDNNVMLKALASHLYETTGAIMLRKSSALILKLSEKYFDKALDLISSNQENLKYKNQEFDPTLAYNVVEESQEKSKTLDDDFTIDYAAKLNMCFDEKEIQFLKSKSSSQDCFKKVEELIESKQSKKSILVEMRKCNLFLPDSSYAEVFYAERIASIYHNWSRIVLYSDINESSEYQKKCMWMTRLSNEIARNCKEKYNVSLFVEHLSKIEGLIPIHLKVNKSSIDNNVEILVYCKESLKKLNESCEVYENGLLKKVFGFSSNSIRIRCLRYIAQANSRLLQLAENKVDVTDADRDCNKLLKLSDRFWRKIPACIHCFIYCAKYYAARKNFKQSMKCFDKFFKRASDESFKIKFDVRCWAIYNYARAVEVCTEDNLWKDVLDEQENRLNDALNKRNDALNSIEVISKDLKEKLKTVLKSKIKRFKNS